MCLPFRFLNCNYLQPIMNLPSSKKVFSIISIYIVIMITIIVWNNYLPYKTHTMIYQRIAKFVYFANADRQPIQREHQMITTKNQTENAYKQMCQVPKLDPWDISIVEFIEHERLLWCIQVQENMTFVDMDGYLRINESGVYFYRAFNDSFTCRYRTFDRSPGMEDSQISYSKELILTDPVKLNEDYVEVVCKNNNDSNEMYRNIHIHPIRRVNQTFGSPNDDNLTVLLFYIDSVSYSVMQRNLPETYNYTKNVMNMKYFEAFNKIGDNTFPNMIAMLTGKRLYDEQEGMMREFDDSDLKSTYDSWPLIWKNFSDRNYSTMFNEDQPQLGLFHYGSGKGFAKKPVDYYHRLYWLAVWWESNENDTAYCFRNELKPQISLDIMKRHLVALNNTLQFMFNIHSEISHDYGSEVERYDDHLKEFWEDMFVNGYLNKSVVIFASDHGHRFSSIRSTLVGLLEERLPFYAIWFPDWFYKLHPMIRENLENNENILTTQFDTYETLVDILNANYDGNQRSSKSRGQSQLYPLPKNRTCSAAGIPDHYCTCIKESNLPLNHPDAKPAAQFLVNYLNSILTNFTQLCETIQLTKILFFRQLDHDEKLKKGIRRFDLAREMDEELMNGTTYSYYEMNYRIGILTEPFNSSFEATVKDVAINGTFGWVINGNSISRINAYKSTSNCISHEILRKYCTCKNVTIPTS